MTRAFVALGSNLDEPAERIGEALQRLSAIPGVALRRHSRSYLTPPWGKTDQPAFVNAAAELDVSLSPERLLAALLDVERVMGRERAERWGPRRIDLDLLYMEGETRSTAELQLPHPRLHERAFVLVPWAEITPDLYLPGLGTLAALLQRVDRAGIQPLP